jgi:hypothetical protein
VGVVDCPAAVRNLVTSLYLWLTRRNARTVSFPHLRAPSYAHVTRVRQQVQLSFRNTVTERKIRVRIKQGSKWSVREIQVVLAGQGKRWRNKLNGMASEVHRYRQRGDDDFIQDAPLMMENSLIVVRF